MPITNHDKHRPSSTGRTAHARPRHGETATVTTLLLAPRVEDFVAAQHVESPDEALTLARSRHADLWRTWRGSELPADALRPLFRDREAYQAAIAAHAAAQSAGATS